MKKKMTKQTLSKFTEMKHPIAGIPTDNEELLDMLYAIITNNVYGVTYSKEDKLFAIELMKQIIEEE